MIRFFYYELMVAIRYFVNLKQQALQEAKELQEDWDWWPKDFEAVDWMVLSDEHELSWGLYKSHGESCLATEWNYS